MTPDKGTIECAICLRPISATDETVACPEPSCGQAYHRECWDYLGGCARYGCPQMKEVKKPEIAVSFWGASQKQCPLCAEAIPIAALSCPFCKTPFQDIKPVSLDDMKTKRSDPALRAIHNTAIRMLVFGLLGLPSPFVLIFGGKWYRAHRQEIDRAGPATRALALMALLVSGLYLAMFFLGLLLYAVVKS